MSALVALKLLVGATALLWVGIAAVRSARDWPDRDRCCGGSSLLDHLPQLFVASAVNGTVAMFLDATQ